MDDASSQGWLVELLSIPQTASVIKKPVDNRIVIGRVDKLKGTIPDVDLTAWGGLEFGTGAKARRDLQARRSIEYRGPGEWPAGAS